MHTRRLAALLLGVIRPLTTDPITAVAAAVTIDEFLGLYALPYSTEEAVVAAIGATLSPIPGDGTTQSFGDGRVGLARIAGPATMTIGDASQSPYCFGDVAGLTSDAEFDGYSDCGDTFDVISGEVVVALRSGYGLSGPAPLGPVPLSVGPLQLPEPLPVDPFSVCVDANSGSSLWIFADPYGSDESDVVAMVEPGQCGLIVTATFTPRQGSDLYQVSTPDGVVGYASTWNLVEQ